MCKLKTERVIYRKKLQHNNMSVCEKVFRHCVYDRMEFSKETAVEENSFFFFFALEAHIAPPRQQEVQSRHVQSPVGVPTGTAGSCNKIDDQRLPALFKSCSWFLEYVSFYMNPELFYYQNISAFEFCFFFKSEILSNFGKIVWIYFCLCDKIKSIPLQKKKYIYIY